MKQYKVTFLQVGHAYVQAENKEEAAALACRLNDSEIHWLNAEDKVPKTRLVTLVEEMNEEVEVNGR